MRAFFLAALLTSPSGASEIQTVPGLVVVPLNTTLVRMNLAAPRLPAGFADPAVPRELPRLAAPVEALGPRPEAQAARRIAPLAVDAAHRGPGTLEATPRAESEAEQGEK